MARWRMAGFHPPSAGGRPISLNTMSIIPSSRSPLPATRLYRDIASTPSIWPSLRMLSAPMPPSSPRATGVCSTAKTDLVRSIGADHVIDYTRADFADGRQHYDLILDIGGSSRLSRLRRALTRRGTLVIAGGEGDRWTGVGRQLRALALSVLIRQRLTMYASRPRHRQADLDTLRQLIDAGQVTPVIDRTYPLAEAPQAIRRLQAGHARGKIVITVPS